MTLDRFFPRREISSAKYPQYAQLARPVGAPSIEMQRREFRPSLDLDLTPAEGDYIKSLRAVVSRAQHLFGTMEKFSGWNPYYPPGLKKAELEQAAIENPDLVSPYTFVRQNETGQLVAVPIVWAQAEQISKLELRNVLIGSNPRSAVNALIRIRKETPDPIQEMLIDQQIQYITAVANSLKTGDFETPMKLWLGMDQEPKIDLILGLFDTANDPEGRKYAWWASVGVLNPEATGESQQFVEQLLDWWGKSEEQKTPKVRVRVDHTIIMSGQAAERAWRANSLPCQREWRALYGSKFVIFEPAFDLGFDKTIYPAFNKYIHGDKRRGVSKSMVKRASIRRLIGHETGHSLNVADDLEERLGKQALPLKELYCDLVSLAGYGLMPRGSIDPQPMVDAREREVALASYLAERYEDKREEYQIAGSVILNNLLQSGTVKVVDHAFTWTTPGAVFDVLSDLYGKVKSLQRTGKPEEVRRFFKENYVPNLYHYSLFNMGENNIEQASPNIPQTQIA